MEELRKHRAIAEFRDAAMGEEVQQMRTQLDHVFSKLNHLISQMDVLRSAITYVKWESMHKCN